MALTRRGFLAGTAVAAGLVGLAGCAGTGQGVAKDLLAAPAADKYPIEPDKEGVAAKYASEEVRDGWTRVTNEDGGAVLGVMDAAKIIQVDGYAFKDMDGDGKLSLWEDWRQTTEPRPSPTSSRPTRHFSSCSTAAPRRPEFPVRSPIR